MHRIGWWRYRDGGADGCNRNADGNDCHNRRRVDDPDWDGYDSFGIPHHHGARRAIRIWLHTG